MNSLKKTLEIDIAYSVNSFIYTLRKLPILKDLFTDDIYASKHLKKGVGVVGLLLSFTRVMIMKIAYYIVLFFLATKLNSQNKINSFFHIYTIFTIIGMFINNKLLNTSKKKYFSLILFNMDPIDFFHANIIWNQFTNLFFNSICIIGLSIMYSIPLFQSLILIIFSFFVRLIGESLNIIFYKKYHYIWYSNTKLYFSIVFILLGISFLPIINIYLSFTIIRLITAISIIIGVFSLYYLFQIKDYKQIYKRLNQVTNPMDSKNEKDYLKQAMVEVKEKDKKIDAKKLVGKKGYDLFNTIFFERHKEILLRSAKKYSVTIVGIYMVLIFLVLTQKNYYINISSFLNHNLGYFVIIMYFINRGSIVTQAMFFNCDHAMLRYNFYREPKNLLGLFKKRLQTIIKVNLLPAIVIGVGNTVLLLITNNKNVYTILATLIFIILLSIFFSVHYLVIYYLLQPYNKEMEIRKVSYSIVTIITYILSYLMTSVVMDSVMFSLLGIVLTSLYIGISLILIYKLAPRTFRID